eukprot:TRINITY_DN8088_c0_g1_i1.p1 TRINITY_DN8088_c0_g1~~TRINITY_DN8088_c0_g1_i1.p1  ORF type:complete len:376 (+),score=159.77 TRINITY_DN8088_c0_g1_i1:616-1743(+)
MSDTVVATAIPLKETMEIDYAKKAQQTGVMKKMNARFFDEVSASRKAMCRAMASGTEGGDTGYTATSEAYLALLGGMLPGGAADKLRKSLFFYWGASVGKKTSLASRDTVYEAASVVLNLGILEMRKGVALLETVSRSNGERVEKECYRVFVSAAGKFQHAYTLMRDVSVNEDYPLDANIDAIEATKFLCLAQAQECALSKASRDPDNRGKALLAKLASQAHQLYDTANEGYAGFVKQADGEAYFTKVLQFAGAKALGLKVKALQLQAMYHSKACMMPEAKSAAEQAAEVNSQLQARYSRESDKALRAYVVAMDAEQQRINNKISGEVRVSGKAKPLDTPVPLIEPQVLAQPAEYSFPAVSEKWTPALAALFEMK